MVAKGPNMTFAVWLNRHKINFRYSWLTSLWVYACGPKLIVSMAESSQLWLCNHGCLERLTACEVRWKRNTDWAMSSTQQELNTCTNQQESAFRFAPFVHRCLHVVANRSLFLHVKHPGLIYGAMHAHGAHKHATCKRSTNPRALAFGATPSQQKL